MCTFVNLSLVYRRDPIHAFLSDMQLQTSVIHIKLSYLMTVFNTNTENKDWPEQPFIFYVNKTTGEL